MRPSVAAKRGFVGLMNGVPGAAAKRFDTSSRSARLLRPLVNVLLPTVPTTVVVRAGAMRGTRLRIDPRNEKFYWTGLYEVGVQEAFVSALRSGATVWDVGAHIGFFTALAARSVGPGGRVHAFEPMRANRMRLLETIELNGLEEVDVHPTAVAGEAGTRPFYAHSSTSMWSLVERNGASWIEVPCVTLDDLLADGSLGIPALVKIDAEGAELDILRGGQRLVTETSAVLVIEFTDDEAVREARRLLPHHTLEPLSDRHWLLRGAA